LVSNLIAFANFAAGIALDANLLLEPCRQLAGNATNNDMNRRVVTLRGAPLEDFMARL
jgi:hypothetical protein